MLCSTCKPGPLSVMVISFCSVKEMNEILNSLKTARQIGYMLGNVLEKVRQNEKLRKW